MYRLMPKKAASCRNQTMPEALKAQAEFIDRT
jgi:hypothetical protein